jgi:MFS family permease
VDRRLSRTLEPLRNSSFRLLFFSTSASSLGTLLAAVALAVDVKDRTNSGFWVGGLLVVDFLPAIFVGLFLGPLLDRLSRRGLMVAADVARAAVFCALPFATNATTIVVLAAVAGLATGFFRPAAYAGVPNLVSPEELPAANSLLQAIENISWTAGPVLGGIIAAASGPHLAYWINAATFLVSAALVVRIPRRLLQSQQALSRGHWRDLADGFAAVRASRALVTVLVVWSIGCLGAGIGNVTEIFLAKDTFQAGDFGYGLLFGAIGLGAVFGNLLAGATEERLGIARTYGSAIGAIGAGFALVAVSPNVWIGALCLCVAGIGNGVTGVCNALLVQRGASDEVRGRALTLIMSTNFVAIGIGMAFGGAALDALGPRGTAALAAVVFGCAALVALVMAGGLRTADASEPAVLEPGS